MMNTFNCCKSPIKIETKNDLRIDKILFDALKRYNVSIEEFELCMKTNQKCGCCYKIKTKTNNKETINFQKRIDIENAIHDMLFSILDIIYNYSFNNKKSGDILLNCMKIQETEYNKTFILKDAAIQSANDVKLYPSGIIRKNFSERKKGSKIEIIELYSNIDDAIKNDSEKENLIAVRVSAPHTGKIDKNFPVLYAKINKIDQHMLRKSYVTYLKMHYSRQEIILMNLRHYENCGMNYYASDITSKVIS